MNKSGGINQTKWQWIKWYQSVCSPIKLTHVLISKDTRLMLSWLLYCTWLLLCWGPKPMLIQSYKYVNKFTIRFQHPPASRGEVLVNTSQHILVLSYHRCVSMCSWRIIVCVGGAGVPGICVSMCVSSSLLKLYQKENKISLFKIGERLVRKDSE